MKTPLVSIRLTGAAAASAGDRLASTAGLTGNLADPKPAKRPGRREDLPVETGPAR